jgi:RNA polymerase sigma-70 factor (ECF subfamily)
MESLLTPADADLVARIAAGDASAFRAFYDRYAGRILAYVRQISRHPEGADDVVQEVFLAVWRKAASYRPERGDVPGWLYTITRNKLVDLWRRKGGTVEDDAFDLESLVGGDRGADGHVVDLSVRKALADLTREQREAVELAYFGGLTYEETARRLELPLGTLKSRIRSGLARMRARLAPEAETPRPS